MANGSAAGSALETLGSIEQFIELANACPDDVHGPGEYDPELESALKNIEAGDNSTVVEWRKRIAKDAERLIPGSGGWTEAHSFLVYVRNTLRAVSRLPSPSSLFEPEPIQLQSFFSIETAWQDAAGILHIEAMYPRLVQLHARFRSLLDGLDATRLRECPICSRLFWARRDDQKACTKVCANRLRVRNFYRKSKDNNRSAIQEVSIVTIRNSQRKRKKRK
jgi:hypothetical protein